MLTRQILSPTISAPTCGGGGCTFCKRHEKEMATITYGSVGIRHMEWQLSEK